MQPQSFSAFEFLKQNKELFATASSLIVTILGAITWSFAYFATQEQLNQLECTTSSNLLVQVLPTAIALSNLKMEQREIELIRLRKEGRSSEQISILSQRIEREIGDIKAEKELFSKKYTIAYDKMNSSDCFKSKEPKEKDKKS